MKKSLYLFIPIGTSIALLISTLDHFDKTQIQKSNARAHYPSTQVINKQLTNQAAPHAEDNVLTEFFKNGTLIDSAKKIKIYIDSLSPQELELEAERLRKGEDERFSNVGRKKDIINKLIFQRWGIIAPKQAIAYCKKLTSYESSRKINDVYEAWSATDPENAVDYLVQERSSVDFDLFDYEVNLKTIMTTWGMADPASALTWLNGRSSQEQSLNNYESYTFLFYHLAQSNPKKALSEVQKLYTQKHEDGEWTSTLKYATGVIYYQLAKKNHETTLTSLNQSSLHPDYILSAQKGLVLEWAEHDIIAAKEWVAQNITPEAQQIELTNACETAYKEHIDNKKRDLDTLSPRPRYLSSLQNKDIIQRQISAIVDYIATLTPDQIQSELNNLSPYNENITSILLVEQWAKKDPINTLTFLKDSERFSNGGPIEHAFYSWLTQAPSSALNYYAKEKLYTMDENIPSSIVEYLMRKSPTQALEWIKNNYSYFEKNKTSITFNKIIADKSPEEIEKLIDTYGFTGTFRTQLISETAEYWATKDWNHTFTWIGTLPKDERDEVYSQAINAYWESLPNNELFKFLDDPKLKNKAAYFILPTLAKESPEKAKQWILDHFPKDQPKGLDSLAIALAKQSPKEAIEFTLSFPDSPLKSNALKYLSCSPDLSFPKKLNLIYDQQKNQSSYDASYNDEIYRLIQEWHCQTPKEALQWINQAPISPQEKAELIKQAQSPRINYASYF